MAATGRVVAAPPRRAIRLIAAAPPGRPSRATGRSTRSAGGRAVVGATPGATGAGVAATRPGGAGRRAPSGRPAGIGDLLAGTPGAPAGGPATVLRGARTTARAAGSPSPGPRSGLVRSLAFLHRSHSSRRNVDGGPPKWSPIEEDVRRRPTLPRSHPRSTIGAEGLSFRVRDGTGRFPFAMVAETLWRCGRTRRPHLGNRTVDA